eukprot:g5211.t1
MKLKQYRTLWGLIDETDGELARSPVHDLKGAVAELSKLGYDGVEIPLKLALYFGIQNVRSILDGAGMKCTIMVFTDGVTCPGAPGLWNGPFEGFTAPTTSGEKSKEKLVKTHLAVFKEQVEAAQALNPTLIVSHTLRDFFTFAMAEEFFSEALRWEQENGFIVAHETHRGRFLYSPWVARDFLPKFPQMKLCADLSHWVNVTETNCDDVDLTRVIEDIASQVVHVHCRVGWEQGPQVSDPRAPEFLKYMEGHEKWWDTIWLAQAAKGMAVSTMIAEHGPPPYQPVIPNTQEPLASIWDVNLWIQLRRQVRFNQVLPGSEHETSKLKPSSTQGFLPATNP